MGGQKPVIGILASLYVAENSSGIGIKRAYLNQFYVEAIQAAGGVAVILPPVKGSDEDIACQLSGIHGLLMSGGIDVNPLLYGEEPCRELETVDTELDEYQMKVVQTAWKEKKPLLGICRGMQLLNVVFGGTLHQDLGLVDSQVKHLQKAAPDIATHTVEIVPESKMAKFFVNDEGNKLLVNSFHHQAVKSVADGFRINARAKDGIVEGIEWNGEEFAVGVQWHPEMMVEKHPVMYPLFRQFVEEAGKHMEK